MAKASTRRGSTPTDPFAASLAQALAFHQQGHHPQAEQLYQRILEKNPRHADALHFSGVLKLQRGQHAEGVTLIQQAISVQALPAMRCNLANGLMALGQHAEALEQLNASLAATPNDPAAHTNRGLALAALGSHDDAIAAHRVALQLRPAFVEAFNNLGNAQRARHHAEAALESYANALRLRPGDPEALNNRGLALADLGRHQEAIASYDEALARRPQYLDALSNRGSSLRECHDFEGAHACFEHVLRVQPKHIHARYNQGNTFGAQNRHAAAIQTYQAVLEQQPTHTEARWNMCLSHLLLGQLEEGWADYDLRWQSVAALTPREFACPQWTGKESLAGRSIVLWAEQGLGDTIQFCRHALNVLAQGAQVFMDVQPSLRSLLQTLNGDIVIVTPENPAPPTDFHCPLLSLPGALGIRLDSIPAAIPYLAARPASIERWHALLESPTPRIGLVASGNAKLANDHRRSIPLSAFGPILDTGHACVLLQKECRSHDSEWLAQEPRLLDLRQQLDDFDDTAAVIVKLDLVVSVDTAVAHLAAALGKPVWLMLPFVPDWRWLLERNDSPWYPGMRLYRQTYPGHWNDLIGRIAHDINKVLCAASLTG